MPSIGRICLAGAAIGLAIGTKYNSGLVVLPFIIAHVYAANASSANWSERLGRIFGARLWAGWVPRPSPFWPPRPMPL